MALDCGEWERLGLPDGYLTGVPIVNVDHHRTTAGFGQVNYVDGTASATGQLIYYLLETMRTGMGPDIATCLYTALASDTGFYRHANTTAEVHRLASCLLDAGADINIRDRGNWTAIMHAQYQEDIEMVEFLQTRGATISEADKELLKSPNESEHADWR